MPDNTNSMREDQKGPKNLEIIQSLGYNIHHCFSFFLDESYALTDESPNTGAIVGAVVGALVVVVAAALFYRYVKKRKEKAYRSSVFRYETK